MKPYFLAEDVVIVMSLTTSAVRRGATAAVTNPIALARMQEQLDSACEFCITASIPLNPPKSALLVISTSPLVRAAEIPLSLNKAPISRVTQQRMLGLHIDEAFTFGLQCRIARTRLLTWSGILGHVCATAWGMATQTTRQVGEQFVLEISLYASLGFFDAATAQSSVRSMNTAYNSLIRTITDHTHRRAQGRRRFSYTERARGEQGGYHGQQRNSKSTRNSRQIGFARRNNSGAQNPQEEI